MAASFPAPAWLVGCGNMAGAMVDGWRSAGIDFSNVTVIRPSGRPVEGIRTLKDYPQDEQPRLVLIGVKPQKLDEIAPGLADFIGPHTVIVSMLAGVSAASLRDRFARAGPILRIMPNLAVADGEGVTAIYSEKAGPGELAGVVGLLEPLGMVVRCESEAELGVIGAVSAAGLAYVARFAEALATSGRRLGLPDELAAAVATQTLIGTGARARASGASMREIARRVASPNGTTEQGLDVLDAPDGLQLLVDRALAAAIRRGEELAAEAARRD